MMWMDRAGSAVAIDRMMWFDGDPQSADDSAVQARMMWQQKRVTTQVA